MCVLKVGLAVGDTAKEKDKATFTRTRLQVEFILELEAMSSFLRRRMRPSDNKRRHGKKVCQLEQGRSKDQSGVGVLLCAFNVVWDKTPN